jgi:acetyl-CoA carboxylase carboxyl transferase subunit beta
MTTKETHKEESKHHFFRRKSLETTKFPKAEVMGDVCNLWVKCPKCGDLSYTREHEKNHRVCQKCNYHFRMRWFERVDYLLDKGSWTEVDAHLTTADPLGFVNDGEVYREKIKQTQSKANIKDSMITGYGTIDGMPVALAIADFAFLGASMGSVFGEKLVRLIELCIDRRMPLVTINASGGARMHEGLFSLMQMAKTTAALTRLGQARLPHISLLTDPCYGGVTASYAMVADFILAEPAAMIGFAGPRVIEQTTRQKLPQGFQTAEFLLDHGMVDQVVPRREQRNILGIMLKLYSRAKVQADPTFLAIPFAKMKAEEVRYVG